MFSFSDTESGWLFMPVFTAAMLKKAFYRINEKFNDTIQLATQFIEEFISVLAMK
jgi:hypothetical protein